MAQLQRYETVNQVVLRLLTDASGAHSSAGAGATPPGEKVDDVVMVTLTSAINDSEQRHQTTHTFT